MMILKYVIRQPGYFSWTIVNPAIGLTYKNPDGSGATFKADKHGMINVSMVAGGTVHPIMEDPDA